MTRTRGLLALLPLFVAGCDCGSGSESDPNPPDQPGGGEYTLEFVTGPAISVDRGDEAVLTARYVDPDGNPVDDGEIWFDIEGEARGSTLDGTGGETDYDGEVTVILRAGSIETDFEVVASADYTDPITYRISVGGPGEGGSLRVELTYGGIRRLHGADIYLHRDSDCDDLDPLAPPAADEATAVQSIRDAATFDGLSVGSEWAVLAVAFNENGTASAWSCWPQATVEDEGETVVTLPLQDLPMTADGRWELQNHFDVGEALPDNIDAIFDALDEMSDDPNDPASFLLDEIRDQIDNDALRVAFDAARVYWNLDQQLNDMILSAAPDFLIDAIGAGGDLGRALTDLRIDSDLRLSEADEFGIIYADHELIDVVLSLDGVTNRFSIANDVNVPDPRVEDIVITLVDEQTLQIEQHQFHMGLGSLVLFALNNIVLPRFEGSPDSLAAMLTEAVSCDAVGDLLSDTVDSGSPSTWEDICGFAVAAVSLYAEQQLLQMNEGYDTLTLEGTAEIKDPNGDLGFDRLQDGEWTSTWSGPAGSVTFPGSFEGNRY